MAVVTYGVTILTFLWVVPFIFWGVGLALVHVFRTADIHETVPPLLAMALVWEMTLIDLFTGQRNGACVEIARAPENWVAVRDSTDLDMGLTMTTNRAWARDWGLPPRAAFHQVWPHGPRSCRRAGVVPISGNGGLRVTCPLVAEVGVRGENRRCLSLSCRDRGEVGGPGAELQGRPGARHPDSRGQVLTCIPATRSTTGCSGIRASTRSGS
ncbi:DUF397 domain-containing protein [Streptomyces sp. NPDC057696]|uniref:DUF397 domain-containing protein n=1 Tax=Streptomyces sp. NPDC057696 TaxID=3346218 RepID=UPI00368321BA